MLDQLKAVLWMAVEGPPSPAWEVEGRPESSSFTVGLFTLSIVCRSPPPAGHLSSIVGSTPDVRIVPAQEGIPSQEVLSF